MNRALIFLSLGALAVICGLGSKNRSAEKQKSRANHPSSGVSGPKSIRTPLPSDRGPINDR